MPLGPSELMILTIGAVLALFTLGLLVLTRWMYRRVEHGQALIVTTPSRTTVTFNGAFVIPTFHRADVIDISLKTLEIERDATTADGERVRVAVTFKIRVNPTEHDIRRVAESIGCARASQATALYELFYPKFHDAIEAVVHHFSVDRLFSDREDLKSKLLSVIGDDLHGFMIDDVSLQVERPPTGSW